VRSFRSLPPSEVETLVLFSSGPVANGATPGQLIDNAYKDLLKAEHVCNAEERSGPRNRDVIGDSTKALLG